MCVFKVLRDLSCYEILFMLSSDNGGVIIAHICQQEVVDGA